MAEYCPKCGKRIPAGIRFCTSCGIALSSVLKGEQDKIPQKSNPAVILIIIGILLVLILVFAFPFLSMVVMGLDSLGSGDPGTGVYQPRDFTPAPVTTAATMSQKDQNIRAIRKIAVDYHATHTYTRQDMYVCGDMSMDIWNMVETKGIPAIIRAGAVDKDVTQIRDVNHAWVMAEVAPGEWIAIEATGGYLACPDKTVCLSNNTRYFSGWDYASPKEFKDYLDKLKHPCPNGYVLGKDQKCHEACGGNTYCSEGTVCVNGDCKGCSAGYVLGQDYRCYPECPAGTGMYCTWGVCGADGRCH